MMKLALAIVGCFAVLSVSACHTDPFGVKPEVNVKLPEKVQDKNDEASAKGD